MLSSSLFRRAHGLPFSSSPYSRHLLSLHLSSFASSPSSSYPPVRNAIPPNLPRKKPSFVLLSQFSSSSGGPVESIICAINSRLQPSQQCSFHGADEKLKSDLDTETEHPEPSKGNNQVFPFEIIEDPNRPQEVILKREVASEKIKVTATAPFNFGKPTIHLDINICDGSNSVKEYECVIKGKRIEILFVTIKERTMGLWTLDKSLQNTVYKYLKLRGINSNFIDFLEKYMKSKNDRECLAWKNDMEETFNELSAQVTDESEQRSCGMADDVTSYPNTEEDSTEREQSKRVPEPCNSAVVDERHLSKIEEADDGFSEVEEAISKVDEEISTITDDACFSKVAEATSKVEEDISALGEKFDRLSSMINSEHREFPIDEPVNPTGEPHTINPTEQPQKFNLGGRIHAHSLMIYFRSFYCDYHNVEDWIYRAEKFFEYYQTPEDQRLFLASLNLDEKASQWYRVMCKSGKINNWEDFTFELKDHFGSDGTEDPIESLAKLRQTTTVPDYLHKFEALANRMADVNVKFLVSCFVDGLQDEIRSGVQMFKPASLSAATELARQHEKLVKPKKIEDA